MLLFRTPSDTAVGSFIASQRALPYSYPGSGATRGGRLPGFRRDHHRVRLGDGEECFRRGARAIRAWTMFDLGWIELLPRGSAIDPETTVAVLARWRGLCFLNACRVVYGFDETAPVRRFGFAYGTLPDHAESGEERFSVEQHADGSVWYDILALSRPHQWLARAGYPVSRGLQRRFARDSMAVMQRACAP